MTHTYKTTHNRHKAMHGLRYCIGGLTLAGIIGAFGVHWILGVVSILPLILLNATLNYYLNARVTLAYLRKDCGINVTWEEAKKYQDYFSPNKKGRWINASHIALLPQSVRRDALLASIADFDEKYGKPDGTSNHEEGPEKKAMDPNNADGIINPKDGRSRCSLK